jgi:hypothetical protein
MAQSISGCWMLDTRYRIPDTKDAPDAGYWMLDTRFCATYLTGSTGSTGKPANPQTPRLAQFAFY